MKTIPSPCPPFESETGDECDTDVIHRPPMDLDLDEEETHIHKMSEIHPDLGFDEGDEAKEAYETDSAEEEDTIRTSVSAVLSNDPETPPSSKQP